MVLLSIIVPIYNTPIAKIERCIMSIDELLLSNKEIECIFVDDGSEEFVGNFFHNHIHNKSYIYIRKENGGASSARNYGIKMAKGQFVMFVDADDAIDPTNMASLLNEELDKDIIFSDLVYMCETEGVIWRAFSTSNKAISISDVLLQLSINGKLNGPVCKLIRRDYLVASKTWFPEEMKTGEDAVFLYRLLRNNLSMMYYPKSTYIYYHTVSTSIGRMRRDPEKVIHDYQTMFEEYITLLDALSVGLSEKDKYIKNRIEQYIKQLFNYKLDLRVDHILAKTTKRSIKTNAIQLKKEYDSIIKQTSQVTRIKFFLINHETGVFESLIALVRKMYLKYKKR